jgi:stage II sporulation protein M
MAIKRGKGKAARTERVEGKKGFIGRYYREAWEYLKKSERFVFLIALVFVAGTLIGFFCHASFSTYLDDFLRTLAEKVAGKSAYELITFIVLNNLESALIGMLLGFVFGVVPVLTSLVNGVVLGYVFNKVAENAGYGSFWRILPHGVFELPAIFVALGLGARLGMFVLAKNKWRELKRRMRKSLIVFVAIVVPLLIIAAIIEGLLIIYYK